MQLSIAIGRRIGSMFSSRRFLGSKADFLSNKVLWKEQAFVNGKWISAANGDVFDVKNPANGEVIARVPKMTAVDAENASSIAYEVWKGPWKQFTAPQRAKVLEKMATLMIDNADDLAKIITLEAGKPLAESKGEILYAASFYKYFSEEARRSYGTIIPSNAKGRADLVFKQSVGPAALVTPWNFPGLKNVNAIQIDGLRSLSYIVLLTSRSCNDYSKSRSCDCSRVHCSNKTFGGDSINSASSLCGG